MAGKLVANKIATFNYFPVTLGTSFATGVALVTASHLCTLN